MQRLLLARLGVHRRLARELRRDLDHRLVDQHRHRVQVAGVALEPEPLRFERQRPAAGEGVVEGGQLVAVEQLLRARMVGVLARRSRRQLCQISSRAACSTVSLVVFSH